LEPARLGCPILLGPHTANFAEPVARLLSAGGALRVEGPDPAGALAALAAGVLSNPGRARAMADAAAAAAAAVEGLPGQVADALLRLLPPPPDAAKPPPPSGRPQRRVDGPAPARFRRPTQGNTMTPSSKVRGPAGA
jgi:3-deoxy-D-manno-octulosonic-acid transferase